VAAQYAENADDRPWAVAPFWQLERTERPRKLSADAKCDTVVVGAGATGLSTALALASRQKVIVVDAKRLAEGSSGWNAGILSLATTLDSSAVENSIGEERTRALSFFLQDSILQMKSTTGLQTPDWQTGSSLYTAARKSHIPLLKQEGEARHKYGLQTSFLQQGHLDKAKLGFCAALELSGEHAVHPAKLAVGMSSAVGRAGGQVCEDSPVDAWRHDGEKFLVSCNGNTIEAQNLVVCPGSGSALFREVTDAANFCIPVVSHILVTEPSDKIAEFVKETHRIAMWDSLRLYHYVRYLPSGRVLVGGEESPGVIPPTVLGADDPNIQRLYDWARRHHKVPLPPIEHCWKASLMLPADGLPFLQLRRFNESLLIGAITDGIPFAFVLGRVIAGLIEDLKHPLSEIFSRRRAMPADARLLSLLPSAPAIRKPALNLAFAAMRLGDLIS